MFIISSRDVLQRDKMYKRDFMDFVNLDLF